MCVQELVFYKTISEIIQMERWKNNTNIDIVFRIFNHLQVYDSVLALKMARKANCIPTLTSILDTMLGEHTMRPVTDTAHNLDIAHSVSRYRIVGIRISSAVPPLFILVTHFTPSLEVRVT